MAALEINAMLCLQLYVQSHQRRPLFPLYSYDFGLLEVFTSVHNGLQGENESQATGVLRQNKPSLFWTQMSYDPQPQRKLSSFGEKPWSDRDPEPYAQGC